MAHILLCDDGSESAARAVRDAAPLLAGRDALTLRVWQSVTASPIASLGGGLAALPADVDEQVAAFAAQAAEQAAARAREAGFAATPLVVEAVGPIWQAIVDVAREREVDLIVMGARGVTGMQRALLGSVSERVTRHADRPVLVMHPRATEALDADRPGVVG